MWEWQQLRIRLQPCRSKTCNRRNSHIGTAIGYFSFPPLLFFLALSIAMIYNQLVGHGIRVPAPSRAQRAGEFVL
jgi:hypothetical protein